MSSHMIIRRRIYDYKIRLDLIGSDSRGAGKFSFILTLPNGIKLFVKDTDGNPFTVSAWDIERAVHAAWDYATMRYGDTDRDFFDNYPANERAWIKSSECDMLGCYVSDRFNK